MQTLKFLACLLLASGVGAEEVRSTLPLAIADSGNLYLQAELVGAVSTSLLFDTGSGYVSLSGKTFNKLSQQSTGAQFQRHIQAVLANGRAQRVPVYQIKELRLAADCVLHNVEVVVFDGEGRDILGLNAIRQLQPFTLNLDPPSLQASCHG